MMSTLALGVWSVVWLALQMWWPGRFPHTDEAYFKEPGYILHTTGRLASPAFAGYYNLKPDLGETFAAYQPLYVLAYAGWLGIVPHTRTGSIAFDALIHLAMVASVVWTLPRLLPRARPQAMVPTAMALLWLGHPARPDELAMAFGVWGLYWLLRRPGGYGGVFGFGLCVGLCAATSLPVTIHIGFCAAGAWLAEWWSNPSQRRVRLATACLGGFVMLAVASAVLVPFYMRTGAWTQYQHIAEDSFFSAVRRSFAVGGVGPYLSALKSCFRSSFFQLPLYGFAAVWVAFRLRISAEPIEQGLLAGGLLSWAFILVAQPGQYLYFWFVFPIIATVLVATQSCSRPVLAAWIILCAVAANPLLREHLKHALLPIAQRPGEVREVIRTVIPTNAVVMVSDRLYFLLRRDFPHLRSAFAGDVRALEQCDYVAFCRDRLLSGEDHALPSDLAAAESGGVFRARFAPVYDGLAMVRPEWLGIPIGATPVGYGARIYAAKDVAGAVQAGPADAGSRTPDGRRGEKETHP